MPKFHQFYVEFLRNLMINDINNLKDGEFVKLNYFDVLNEDILFINDYRGKHFFTTDRSILSKIDFSNISFDNFCSWDFDFTNLHGVCLDPLKVWDKNLSYGIYNGVRFNGSFDGVKIFYADFTNSVGANIDLSKVWAKDGRGCVFCDCLINGSLDGCRIDKSSFFGVKNVVNINPQKVFQKNLSNGNYYGVYFTDCFDDCKVFGSNFNGSYGAVMNSRVWHSNFNNTILSSVCFDEYIYDAILAGADFTNSRGAVIVCDSTWGSYDNTNFTDAKIIGDINRCVVPSTSLGNAIVMKNSGRIRKIS